LARRVRDIGWAGARSKRGGLQSLDWRSKKISSSKPSKSCEKNSPDVVQSNCSPLALLDHIELSAPFPHIGAPSGRSRCAIHSAHTRPYLLSCRRAEASGGSSPFLAYLPAKFRRDVTLSLRQVRPGKRTAWPTFRLCEFSFCFAAPDGPLLRIVVFVRGDRPGPAPPGLCLRWKTLAESFGPLFF
jgi:hypothetical protein